MSLDHRVFPCSHTAKIRCLLVDSHILVRLGVRRLLEGESDFEVAGEAGSASEMLAKMPGLRPNLVLMDVSLPGMSPLEVAQVLRRDYPRTRLVFLTMHDDEEHVMQALAAGAAGYVLKSTTAAGLLSALRLVHGGGNFVSPQVLRHLVDKARQRSADAATAGESALTPREREVTKMIAEGNSVKEIAHSLGLSVKTVEAHKFNLMRKLDIHNKAQLVTYAIQKKIVKIPMEA